MTSTQEKAAVVCEFIERLYGERDLSVVDDLFASAPDLQRPKGEDIQDPEEIKSYTERALEKFEDVDCEITHTFVDGDRVAVEWKITATLVEEYLGIAPTGREVDIDIVTVASVVDGEIVRMSDRYDRRKLMPTVSRMARSGIIENMHDGVIVIDEDETVADINPEALSALGFERFDVVGEPAGGLFPSDVDMPAPGDTTEFTLADGRRVFELTASVVTDTRDERIGRMLLLHEISERERRSKQLAVLNRVLRHNLRNALTTIIGQGEYLTHQLPADDSDLADAREASETIVDTGRRLSSLSEKVTHVGDALEPDDLDVRTQDLIDALAPVIARVETDFPDVDVATDVPDTAPVTATRSLQFALEAVVENACEHNDHPQPEVAVSVDRRPDDDCVRFTVADNGPGIPELEQQVLEDGEETPLRHGSGLGLWLVYWVVTLSGGELSFRENDPRGTVVTISLPTPDGGRAGSDEMVDVEAE